MKRKSMLRWGAAVVAVVLAGLVGLAAVAGFFDRDAVRLYSARGGTGARVAVAFFSGDMGLRFGAGAYVAPELAKQGLPVVAINSPTAFGRHRSRAEVDRIVADAARRALATSGADRVVLVGQSFGADMLSAGAADLPADLRSRVAAVALIVPGRDLYFRADPTGGAYHGTPDANGPRELRRVDWAPVICIYGARETDSVCPALIGGAATVIEMPGGHFLRNDYRGLFSVLMNALAPILHPAGARS